MTAKLSRRRFSSALIASGVTVLATGVGTFFEGGQVARSIILDAKEKRLFAGLTQLFPRILLHEAAEGEGRLVRASVSIDDIQAFLDPVRRSAVLPDVIIQAEGDMLRFSHEHTNYELRLLLPQDFSSQTGQALNA